VSRKFLPLSIPNLGEKEIEYVTNAVKTGWISTAGPYVAEFESKLSEYVSCKGAVSCQNGTSGLHTALMVCGISKTVKSSFHPYIYCCGKSGKICRCRTGIYGL